MCLLVHDYSNDLKRKICNSFFVALGDHFNVELFGPFNADLQSCIPNYVHLVYEKYDWAPTNAMFNIIFIRNTSLEYITKYKDLPVKTVEFIWLF